MLKLSNISDFLDRISVEDFSLSNFTTDTTGDLVSVFDPETDYKVVRKAIEESRPIRNKVVDSGLSFTELSDTVYVNGNRADVLILCESGDNGFGTSIKIMTKSVDYYINGELKQFLSFEALNRYIERLG